MPLVAKLEELMSNKVFIETNSHQTPIDQTLKSSITSEAWSALIDFVTSVPFVSTLISEKRLHVSDLPRDDKGRAIVDVTKPHILEDMDYFIQPRLNYLKYGEYTTAKFSLDPKSAYILFWDEEKRRSLDGYVNTKTGEWIPGYLYWYWNYSRIKVTEAKKGSKKSRSGKTRGDRIDRFPDIWEIDYFFFHYIEQAEEEGEHSALLKCRGIGFSFKAAAMCNRNFFLIQESKSYVTAALDGYLYDDGLMNKVLVCEAFVQKKTAYTKTKIHSSLEQLMSGYKDLDNNNALSGYLSEITAVNTRNPHSIRGKRGKLVIHEEAGSNKNLTTAWGISDKSVDDRDFVFGMQLAAGTGGDKNSDFAGLIKLFYTPRGFSVYGIPNVFDKNASANLSGFFIGEYMNRPNTYNSDGVTDVVRNLVTIFERRVELEKILDDADILARKIAEGALTPLEAIVTMQTNDFPKELVKLRLVDLQNNFKTVTRTHQYVKLNRTGESVKISHGGVKPILDYPYLGAKAGDAAMTIKNLPETHTDGSIVYGRYIIGLDTLDDDGGVGSLFSFQVMDLWKDTIVAWYIGRDVYVENDYDLVLSAAVLYNAQINYESNLKGFYGFCKTHSALHYLADTPEILVDKSLVGGGTRVGNKSKGTRATKPINTWGRKLQASYLRNYHTFYPDLKGVDVIEDIEYLREISAYLPSGGNYDKISSGNMLFILREDRMLVTGETKFNPPDKNDYEDDEFFNEFELPLTSSTQNELDLDF